MLIGLTPVFSGGFGKQGIYRIFISFPIINRQTQEFLGIVGKSIPSESFFCALWKCRTYTFKLSGSL